MNVIIRYSTFTMTGFDESDLYKLKDIINCFFLFIFSKRNECHFPVCGTHHSSAVVAVFLVADIFDALDPSDHERFGVCSLDSRFVDALP